MSAPSTTKNDTLTKELHDLEKRYWDALQKADPDALRTLTGESFFMTMEDGISQADNKQFVDMMTSGEMKLRSYKFDEGSFRVFPVTQDVAIVAYKAHSNFERGGKGEEMDNYYASTWLKKGGTWRVVAGAVTCVK
jgi:hypothetical protein